MTKPSYEELDRLDAELHAYIDGRIADDPDALLTAKDAWKLRDVIAELARVRGLLQRQWISVEERLPETEPCTQSEQVLTFNGVYVAVGAYHRGNHRYEGYWTPLSNISHWQPFADPPTFPQSSSLVPSGAESADIGKLDTVDKKSDG